VLVLGQHQCVGARCHARVSGIFRSAVHLLVIVIALPEECAIALLEADNPPWKKPSEVRRPRHEGRCYHHVQAVTVAIDQSAEKTLWQSATPVNLVPACMDCNMNKTNATPTCAEEQTIHPYFDDIEDELWLTATVVEERPAALLFDVAPPAHWPDVLAARVQKHFSTFRLQYLYGVNAAREMAQQRGLLKKLHAGAGAADVRAYLQDQAEKLRADRHQLVAHRGLQVARTERLVLRRRLRFYLNLLFLAIGRPVRNGAWGL
jgi:hypothetical protein